MLIGDGDPSPTGSVREEHKQERTREAGEPDQRRGRKAGADAMTVATWRLWDRGQKHLVTIVTKEAAGLPTNPLIFSRWRGRNPNHLPVFLYGEFVS